MYKFDFVGEVREQNGYWQVVVRYETNKKLTRHESELIPRDKFDDALRLLDEWTLRARQNMITEHTESFAWERKRELQGATAR